MAPRNHRRREPANARSCSTSCAPIVRWPRAAGHTGARSPDRPASRQRSLRVERRFRLRAGPAAHRRRSLPGRHPDPRPARHPSRRRPGRSCCWSVTTASSSSVDAGGAFGLLATETSAVELTSLWRFDHEWEAAAGQQLRVGDTGCLDTYAAHGRLHEGPAEADGRRRLHARGTPRSGDGQQALLIAADNATVAELNTQARAGRVRDGARRTGRRRGCTTTRPPGSATSIVTRRNRRDLRTSTGAWVRNGDLWTVTARDDDGSLTRATKPPTASATHDATGRQCGCPPTTSPSMSNSATPPPRTAPKG